MGARLGSPGFDSRYDQVKNELFETGLSALRRTRSYKFHFSGSPTAQV